MAKQHVVRKSAVSFYVTSGKREGINMSRLGKTPIELPEKVEVKIADGSFHFNCNRFLHLIRYNDSFSDLSL